MQILNITKTKKKYKIEFENKKSVYVSEDTVIKFNLIKKISLTEEQLEEILKTENKEKSFGLGLNYLSYGLRTEYEIREYLKKKEIIEENIEYAVNKLKDYKYLNDERYCNLAVTEYFDLKKKGPAWIKRKLEDKGLDITTIEKNLTKICLEDKQIDNLYGIIEKEYIKRNEPKNKKIQKITTKLYTNGYSFDIINKVFKLFFENYEEENEENNIIKKYYDKAYSRLNKKYADKYTLKQKIIEKLLRDGFSYSEIKGYLNEIDF